jgi:hypothetical protein
MEQKPIYFDGSVQNNLGEECEPQGLVQLTDKIRKSIGINPYSLVDGE